MGDSRRRPPPWVFSLLILPLGVSLGFKFTPRPFLLVRADVPVYDIGRIASVVHLPAVFMLICGSRRGRQRAYDGA
jgi:hypothetical protein